MKTTYTPRLHRLRTAVLHLLRDHGWFFAIGLVLTFIVAAPLVAFFAL